MGYTLIANTLPRSASNDEFRAWGSMISNMFANSGLVAQTGIGEINWTTVAMPGAAYAVQGYEVWRFADALQSTYPVYFRVDYGSGQTNNRPAMWFTIGSGIQSNGNLTGVRSPITYTGNGHSLLAGANSSANTLLTYYCGDTSRFVIAWCAAGTGANSMLHMFASMERTVDANGSPTGDGVLLAFSDYNVRKQVAWQRTIGDYTAVEESWGILMPNTTSGVSGSNTAVYPLFHAAGPYLNPGLNLLSYFQGDFTANTSNALTFYGTSHTYMPLGNAAIHTTSRRAGAASTLMIRWE